MSTASLRDKRLLFLLLSVAICGVVGVTYAYLIHPRLLAVPRTSEIESMKGEIIELNLEAKSFEVDPEYFPKILGTLAPAQRDYFSLDWGSLGRITIRCNDGKVLIIDLWRTGEVKGAFSIRPEGKPSSSIIIPNDFRGGTEANIERMLREAYAASKRHDK